MRSFVELINAAENAVLSSFSGFAYRVVPYRYRSSLLSSAGALMNGGRYNPPNEFGLLYICDSQLTANLEVNALFMDSAGRLIGAPRDPDLMLTLKCELSRVLDLTCRTNQEAFGTTVDELTSSIPSRHILNPQGQLTPTQILGKACYEVGCISALIVPSAANVSGFCLDVFPDRLVRGESLSIVDSEGSFTETLGRSN